MYYLLPNTPVKASKNTMVCMSSIMQGWSLWQGRIICNLWIDSATELYGHVCI